jgi:diguanylate cyclase (GGDEF)-like protein
MGVNQQEIYKAKVLLIDDDDTLPTLIKQLFANNGDLARDSYQLEVDLVTAQTGREGLDILVQQGGIDLVITDFEMPDMDGFDVAARILGYDPSNGVIEKPSFEIVDSKIKPPSEPQTLGADKIVGIMPDLPVILFTAHGKYEHAASGSQLGIQDYLGKPLAPEFLPVVYKALKMRVLERENGHIRTQLEEQNVLLSQQSKRLEEVVAERTRDLEAQSLVLAQRTARFERCHELDSRSMEGVFFDYWREKRAKVAYQTFMKFAPIGIIAINGNHTIADVNAHFLRITGKTLDEVKGLDIIAADPVDQNLPDAYLDCRAKYLAWKDTQRHNPDAKEPNPDDFIVSYRYVHGRGKEEQILQYKIIPVDVGDPQPYFLAMLTDITQDEKRNRTDPLTGLITPSKWKEIYHTVAAQTVEDGHTYAFIAIDIDHFGEYNTLGGHELGDMVLESFGGRLLGLINSQTDLGLRTGGDEMAAVLVLDGSIGIGSEVDIARRIQEALSGVYGLDQSRNVTCSVGVARYEPGTNPQEVYVRADDAMYHSKNNGRNQVTQWHIGLPRNPEREQTELVTTELQQTP